MPLSPKLMFNTTSSSRQKTAFYLRVLVVALCVCVSMNSVQMLSRFFYFSVFSVLPYGRCMDVSVGQEQYEVAKGGEVSLPCSFSPARPDYTNLVLSWKAFPDKDGDPLVRG